jgi:hypothetical protein
MKQRFDVTLQELQFGITRAANENRFEDAGRLSQQAHALLMSQNGEQGLREMYTLVEATRKFVVDWTNRLAPVSSAVERGRIEQAQLAEQQRELASSAIVYFRQRDLLPNIVLQHQLVSDHEPPPTLNQQEQQLQADIIKRSVNQTDMQNESIALAPPAQLTQQNEDPPSHRRLTEQLERAYDTISRNVEQHRRELAQRDDQITLLQHTLSRYEAATQVCAECRLTPHLGIGHLSTIIPNFLL